MCCHMIISLSVCSPFEQSPMEFNVCMKMKKTEKYSGSYTQLTQLGEAAIDQLLCGTHLLP